MKTFLSLLILLSCIAVGRSQALNTTVVGNSTLTNSLIVSKKVCKLYAVSCYNASANTQFVQIFATNNVPSGTMVPLYSYPAPATNFLSYDFSYYGADIYPGCYVAISTSATNLVLAPANSALQAIIKSN